MEVKRAAANICRVSIYNEFTDKLLEEVMVESMQESTLFFCGDIVNASNLLAQCNKLFEIASILKEKGHLNKSESHLKEKQQDDLSDELKKRMLALSRK